MFIEKRYEVQKHDITSRYQRITLDGTWLSYGDWSELEEAQKMLKTGVPLINAFINYTVR